MTSAPRRIRESGSFDLPLPPNEAFALFTAEGEKLWVPGWDPELLGETPQQPGLVFLTGEGEERTIWTVLESNLEDGCLRYGRVTPLSRAGTVEVTVKGQDGGSRVEVAYDLTALSFAGAQTLENYSGESFSLMMGDWRKLILQYLGTAAQS